MANLKNKNHFAILKLSQRETNLLLLEGIFKFISHKFLNLSDPFAECARKNILQKIEDMKNQT